MKKGITLQGDTGMGDSLAKQPGVGVVCTWVLQYKHKCERRPVLYLPRWG